MFKDYKKDFLNLLLSFCFFTSYSFFLTFDLIERIKLNDDFLSILIGLCLMLSFSVIMGYGLIKNYFFKEKKEDFKYEGKVINILSERKGLFLKTKIKLDNERILHLSTFLLNLYSNDLNHLMKKEQKTNLYISKNGLFYLDKEVESENQSKDIKEEQIKFCHFVNMLKNSLFFFSKGNVDKIWIRCFKI